MQPAFPHRVLILTSVVLLSVLWLGASVMPELKQTGGMTAPEAVQAAAADREFVYAVSSTAVAKYGRATGRRLAVSSGEARHLNSAFLWEGKLYCAHSNFPRKPEHSEIKVLDPASMALTTFKDFGASKGSLTWAVREGDHWWCNFAYYGKENARTRLVKFDADWRELQEWVYPASVIRELGDFSISGGIWFREELWVTGHDRRAVYRLGLPKEGNVLELNLSLRSPFPGQGIALDPANPRGVVGIDRERKAVIFAELRE